MLPAARIHDQHACPVHGGGPTLPPGAATVLVNQLPAVGVTDRCTCAGPTDFVVTGAATVLVGGKFAARLTEKTMHGPGLVLGASPNVLIGGPSAGATLGGRGCARACTAAANGRESKKTKQSYGNCGIESSRQLINRATGKDLSEQELFDDAVAHGEALQDDPITGRCPNPADVGGSSPDGRQKLLARHGVTSKLVPQHPPNELMQAVAEGKGVITSHDAGKLWGDKDQSGYHAILMTGIVFDEEGRPVEVITNDTGLGACGNGVPAKQFFGSLTDRRANVTDDAVWK